MAYDANSIKVRSFREATRSSPGMYLGADGQDAVFNCFLEILNNSCDEAIMGRGNEITIELDGDSLICVDKGSGIPRGPNADCDEVLIELMCSAHSSGKFDSENYSRVRGCHGCGQGAVCMCSDVFEVWSRRDGAEWYLKFCDGVPQDTAARALRKTNETGTTVKFTPSREVFHIPSNVPCFDAEKIENELELTSYFIPGVTFIYKNGEKVKKFYSKNGLIDFAAARIKNPIHKNYIYNSKHFDDNIDIEVFAQWTTGKEKCYVFSNGALNSGGGTPITGMKTAFTRTINDLSKKSFESDTVRKGLVTIINIKHPHPIYQNQVKDKIQNSELRGYTQTVFTEAIKDWVAKNKSDFDKIVDMLSKETKAIEAAERARSAVLNMDKKEAAHRKKKIAMPDKFMDCEIHGENSLLLVCEGDSAVAGLNPARDINNEAIYAVRGKVKNLLKAPLEECLENQEVSDIILALGCGIQERYNSKKLNYGKVGIAVDSDVDGYNIMCLIATMFYVLMPKFIEEGRLCWLRAPLYHLTKGNQRVFAYDDNELNELKQTRKSWEQGRLKGLGEMTAHDMELSMMNKEARRLEVLTISDAIAADKSIRMLMGNDVTPRRKFLFENVDFSVINR